MLTGIIRFEWRYHTRQPAFLAASALFLLLGFALTASGFGPQNVAITSPRLVMETQAFLSLFSVFAIAIFVANAALRDGEHRMEEIVFSTPVGRFNYLLGRFSGAFAAALTTTALAPIGMIAASRMPSLDPARVGPIEAGAYLWPFVTMVVPTLLFATALLFALATLTRSALATYTASVFICLLYMAGAALTDSPLMAASTPGAGGGTMAALLDPFGLSSFFEMTRYWTIAEKNHRFVALEGTLLLNRALWIAAAAALWGLTWRRFAFRVQAADLKARASRRGAPLAAPASIPGSGGDTASGPDVPPGRGAGQWTESPSLPKVPTGTGSPPVPYVRREPRRPGARAAIASYLSATRIEVASAARSRPFLLLLGLWFALATMEIRSELFEGEYGSASYPATAFILDTLRQPLSLIGTILVIYYGAEIFWREQRFRVASIIDATPVRGAVLALAKWTAIGVMIGLLLVAGIAAGVLAQAMSGYRRLEPVLYLSLFFLVGLPLVLFAAAAMAIHAVSPGKYTGLVLVLLFAIVTRRPTLLGLEHPLWRFGSGPPVDYSAMYGFSDSIAPFGWLMLHWSVMAVAFLATAGYTWRRLRDSARARVRAIIRHAATAGRPWLGTLLVALSITTGWIVYQTSERGGYQSGGALLDWKGEYEKRYRSLTGTPQPRLEEVRTQVDIFPERRRVRVTGDYTLINDTAGPITTLHVNSRRDALETRLSVPSARVRSDSEYGMYRFDLQRPLEPGDRTTLHFDLTFGESGFEEGNRRVAENGSVIMSFVTYPALGYRTSYEIRDPRERAKRGLGPTSTPELEDADAPTGSAELTDTQRVRFEATVSTSADQTAIASGTLLREWTAEGRRWFQYRSDAPVRNLFAIVSARYAIERRRAGDVEVSIAYHPAHGANVRAIIDAAVKALEYCDAQFGRYPHRQLKLVEVPASWNFGGFAVPDTLLFSERRTFLVDGRSPDRLDLVARRGAHEVGHQWWGYQLVAANRGGALMLTESLARYTELMVLERLHGRDEVRRQLQVELDRYLAGRAREEERERTLVNVGQQPYLYYSKGALVMYAIRDLIGEAAFNLALHRLIEEGRNAAATGFDLLRQLRAVSNDAQYALIDAWLQRIVLYDLKAAEARTDALAGGRFRVTVRVVAARRQADAQGAEEEVPLDEAIDVALFRRDPGATPSRELIAMERRRLRSGMNELSFEVGEVPAYVIVDPYQLRIDRNRFDNGRRVEPP